MRQRDRTPKARQNRQQAKAKRRAERMKRETPREHRRRQESLVARTGEGVERIERMTANAPKVERKPCPRYEWSVWDCDCDPPRNHGPHRKRSIVEEETEVAAV